LMIPWYFISEIWLTSVTNILFSRSDWPQWQITFCYFLWAYFFLEIDNWRLVTSRTFWHSRWFCFLFCWGFLICRKPSANSRPYFLLLPHHSNFCSLFLFLLPFIQFFFFVALSKLVQTCPNLSQLVPTCPNLSQLVPTCPNFPVSPLFPLFDKKMWIKKDNNLAQFGFGDFPRLKYLISWQCCDGENSSLNTRVNGSLAIV